MFWLLQTQRKHCPCGLQLFQSVSGPLLVKSLHAGLIFSQESGHYLALTILTPPVHKQLTLSSFSKGSLRHRSSATALPCVISQTGCLQMSGSHTLLAPFPPPRTHILCHITGDLSHELVIDLFSFKIRCRHGDGVGGFLLAGCELQLHGLAELVFMLIEVLVVVQFSVSTQIHCLEEASPPNPYGEKRKHDAWIHPHYRDADAHTVHTRPWPTPHVLLAWLQERGHVFVYPNS